MAQRHCVRQMTMQQRAQETLRQLCEVFPDFEEWWKVAESPPPEDGLMDGVFLSMDASPRDARISNGLRRSIRSLLRGSSGDLAIGLAKQSPSMATSRTLCQPALLNKRVR